MRYSKGKILFLLSRGWLSSPPLCFLSGGGSGRPTPIKALLKEVIMGEVVLDRHSRVLPERVLLMQGWLATGLLARRTEVG